MFGDGRSRLEGSEGGHDKGKTRDFASVKLLSKSRSNFRFNFFREAIESALLRVRTSFGT
jgi:hypothetical protein